MTKMRRVMAVKPHKYGTRHLTAGEEYEIPARHALALLAGKKVRYLSPAATGGAAEASPRPPAKPPSQSLPPVQEPAAAARMEIEALRIEAERLGIEVDGRWGVPRLQYEIAKARNA